MRYKGGNNTIATGNGQDTIYGNFGGSGAAAPSEEITRFLPAAETTRSMATSGPMVPKGATI